MPADLYVQKSLLSHFFLPGKMVQASPFASAPMEAVEEDGLGLDQMPFAGPIPPQIILQIHGIQQLPNGIGLLCVFLFFFGVLCARL